MKELKGVKLRSFTISVLLGLFITFPIVLTEILFAQTTLPAEKTLPRPEIRKKLIIAQETDSLTLDAHHVIDSSSAAIMEHMVEPLFELTPKGEILPRLVEAWKISAGATEFTLKLREGIKFHDGQPFNAEAVKINFDRRLDPKAGTKFYFLVAAIASVTVVDEYTLKIKTKMPFVPLLNHLTFTTNGIQSPAALRRSWDKPLIMPIGTGPFIFKEWVPGNRLVMVQNDAYWGTKSALSEVIFRVIPDQTSRIKALETGEAHVAVRLPPTEIPRLKANPKIRILHIPSIRTLYMGLNCLKGPFIDKRVRQALNYAVNKGAIINSVLGGKGRVSDAPISPSVFGYTPIKTYEYNPERAKALLAEAGFPEGFETILYTPVGRYHKDVSVAAAVAADLQQVGVKADLKMLEWGTYLSSIFQEGEVVDHQIFMLGWGCVTGDADYGLYTLFHSGEWPRRGLNASFFKNEKVDHLLDAARMTDNSKERKKIYKEAMTLIMDDAPWIFLHSEIQIVGVRANVKDIQVHPTEWVIAKEAKIE